jgi:hypothetical protein
MKDEQDIWAYLRAQLPEHPELRQQPLIGAWGTGQRCFACDELIREEHAGASRYACRARNGHIHWFHPHCETILQRARYPSGKERVEERRRQDSAPNG